MTDNEPLHMSFDNLPRAVAELHSKIDTAYRNGGETDVCKRCTAFAGDNDSGGCIGDAVQIRFHHLCHDFRASHTLPQARQQALLHAHGD